MMIEHEKTDALLAVAKAFYDRGPCVQYDQLSMDRLLRVTPRRRRMAAPEDATRQSTLFLDCSSFVWAAYYNAFGYALEADLSWEMIDMVKPRVFYYELTHRETEEERARMAEVIRELLCPGDVIIFEGGGNGHVMLYQGGESYINCTQAGRAGSYDYVARRDTRPEHGGIRIEDIAHLFAPCADKQLGRNYLFGEKVKRFCVLRPLARVNQRKTCARVLPDVGSLRAAWKHRIRAAGRWAWAALWNTLCIYATFAARKRMRRWNLPRRRAALCFLRSTHVFPFPVQRRQRPASAYKLKKWQGFGLRRPLSGSMGLRLHRPGCCAGIRRLLRKARAW